MAVNAEPKLQRTRHSPGSHRVVKLKHHTGIIELPWCHEWKQGILRDQPHGVSEPRVGGQRWYIIEWIPVEVLGTQIYVPRNRVTGEHGTPDPRGW